MPLDLTQPLANLPDPLPIPTIERPFDATIRPPGSKSITNRALLLAGLASGISTLRGALLDADDARVMLRALGQLGVRIDHEDGGILKIHGVAGRWRVPPVGVTLNLNNAGTATRFLTAAALLAPPGTWVTIDGDRRMRERPIRELVDALMPLAIGPSKPEYPVREGYPPVRIPGVELDRGAVRTVTFGTTESSQFVSAVLMLGSCMRFGLRVEFTGPITSEPYIDMTLGLLARHRVAIGDHRPAFITVGNAHLDPDQHNILEQKALPHGVDLDIEPDASGATYFEAAAALIPGARVTIDGLDLGPRGSLQGDTQFVRVLTELGATVERVGIGKAGGGAAGIRVTGPRRLHPIDADLSNMPDTAMTAAVLCCFAEPTPGNPSATSTLRGLRTLRVKETDRLEALRTELTKLGAQVEIFAERADESLRITPPPASSAHRGGAASAVTFDTYKDHRMAMALALIGLRVPGVLIRDPGCVGKTYPGFWGELGRVIGAS